MNLKDNFTSPKYKLFFQIINAYITTSVIVFFYMINLNLLSSFFICAEHLNMSKAATILGISQPSLSVQIRNLEEQVGASLFLRNGKTISLTAKGQELLQMSSVFYELQEEISQLAGSEEEDKKQESLRILVTHEVERPFVAELVSKFAKREKKRLSILAATTEEALSMAESSQTDILLSHEKVNSSFPHVRVEFPVYFATAERAPSRPAFNDPSNVEKILDYYGEDLVIPTRDTKLGQEFETFRRKNKIRREIILESNIVSCLVRSVASGAGCAFLPLPYVQSSLYKNHIQLIGPREGFWKHSIYIYANLSKPDLETHPIVKFIRNFQSI